MSKIDVSWSPSCYYNLTGRDLFFVVQPNELALYGLRGANLCPQGSSSNVVTSDKYSIELLTRNDDSLSFVRCFDPYPSGNSGTNGNIQQQHVHLVAVGQTNGRVRLTNPCSSTAVQSEDPWLGRELAPKHSRACLCLAWNQKTPNLLAIGLERYRTDNSLLVWDLASSSQSIPQSLSKTDSLLASSIFSSSTSSQQPMSGGEHYSGSSGLTKNVHQVEFASGLNQVQPSAKSSYETAQSETCHSVCWLKQNPRVLAAGLSNKYIKIYDLGDFSRSKTSIPTKCCSGLCTDPFNDYRLASFSDCQVSLWDLRYPDKALLNIVEPKPVVKLQFDPTKRNVLATLAKEAQFLRVYRLQQITVAEETEVNYIENIVEPKFDQDSPSPPHTWTSFAYHPVDENRLLFVNCEARPIYWSTCFSMPIQWCPFGRKAADPRGQSRMLVAFPKMMVECDTGEDDEDLAARVRRLTSLGYGVRQSEALGQCLLKASELCCRENEPNLAQVWLWMHKINQLTEEEAENWAFDVKYPGALNIIQQHGGQLKASSNLDYRSSCLDVAGHTLMTKFFVSPERDRLLQLCGWGGMTKERMPSNDTFIKKILADRQFERAAAICVFTLRLKAAVQILMNASNVSTNEPPNAASKNLHLVALALAGYPGLSEKENYSSTNYSPSLWLDMCDQTLSAASGGLQSPYLKAAFQFLACRFTAPGSSSYDAVLETQGLPLLDKIAFAAVHLSDAQFVQFLEKSYDNYFKAADLIGLILCGLCNEKSLALIENYIDRTGDVQTAALLILHGGTVLTPVVRTTFANLLSTGKLISDGPPAINGSSINSLPDLARGLPSPTGQQDSSSHDSSVTTSLSNSGSSFSTTLFNNQGGSSAGSVVGRPTENDLTAYKIVCCYLDLLDSCRLWKVRAETEVTFCLNTGGTSKTAIPGDLLENGLTSGPRINATFQCPLVPHQVYITCTFCSKRVPSSLSALHPNVGRSQNLPSSAGAGARPQRFAKPTSCPNCKKPLPRCALCRLHMGTQAINLQTLEKLNKFDSWFSWCQNCRHGGHVGHLNEWFKEHDECPVAGCQCLCSSLDVGL